MRRFEAEPRAKKPADFDEWADELGLLADTEGAHALIGMLWYAPPECIAYLMLEPGLWPGLLARGTFADMQRYVRGVMAGRVGL